MFSCIHVCLQYYQLVVEHLLLFYIYLGAIKRLLIWACYDLLIIIIVIEVFIDIHSVRKLVKRRLSSHSLLMANSFFHSIVKINQSVSYKRMNPIKLLSVTPLRLILS